MTKIMALLSLCEADQSLKSIRDQFSKMGVEISAHEGDGKIAISKIMVDKAKRGVGLGSQAMQALTTYADSKGLVIVLTPSTDFGATSVSRLIGFYKQFGFVENKGRNKDYRVSHTMYRQPR